MPHKSDAPRHDESVIRLIVTVPHDGNQLTNAIEELLGAVALPCVIGPEGPKLLTNVKAANAWDVLVMPDCVWSSDDLSPLSKATGGKILWLMHRSSPHLESQRIRLHTFAATWTIAAEERFSHGGEEEGRYLGPALRLVQCAGRQEEYGHALAELDRALLGRNTEAFIVQLLYGAASLMMMPLNCSSRGAVGEAVEEWMGILEGRLEETITKSSEWKKLSERLLSWDGADSCPFTEVDYRGLRGLLMQHAVSH